MQTIPNSTLYLCKNVELDPNYNYTIDFDNITTQDNYFINKVAGEFDINTGYSYIRDTQTLKVQANIDSLMGINYLFYDNGNKRYYAFITRKDYINPNCTSLSFKIDVLQSFMFDYEIDESFIEREHQDRYTKESTALKAKYNIELENLEAGNEYDIVSKAKIKDNANAPNGLVWVEVLATQPIIKDKSYSNTNSTTFKNLSLTLTQSGVATGLYSYLFPSIIGQSVINNNFYTYNGEGNIVELATHILSVLPKSTAVLSIRVLHYCPIKYNITEYNNGYLITFPSGYMANSNDFDTTDIRVITTGNDNFGGLNLSNYGGYHLNLTRITKNNINNKLTHKLNPITIPLNTLNINNLKNADYETKLLTHPYEYIQLTDYQSNPLKIKNENIDTTKDINFTQSIGVQSKFKLYVENYNNDNGKEYNATNTTISELPLTNDAYISYMAQNKASATTGVALNIASGVATLALGIATGGIGLVAGAGMALGSLGQVANQMIKMQELKDTPDNIRQAGNNAEFDLLDNNYQIVLSKHRIKEAHYLKLFNFFYHYGYKCNNFKKPNVRSRYYFNYIKAIGANIKSNIDSEYRNEIATIYDKGITIWHYRNAQTFKGVNNYDYENVEINLMEV